MEYKVSSEILKEVTLLIEAFGLGVILMLFYDGIRFLRYLIKHHDAVVVVEDLLFWVAASGCVFYLLYLENSGRVRLYAIAGTAVGMLLYYVLWGRRWRRLFDKLIENVKKSWIFREKG